MRTGSGSDQPSDSEPSHDDVEGLVGVGGDVLGEGVDVGGVRVFLEEEEQAVTKHGHGRDGVGVAASCLVFEQAGVFAPVVSDFDASPMPADGVQPPLRAHALSRPRAEIVAGETVVGILEGGRVTPNANDGLHMGEVDVERVNCAQRDIVVIYPSVGLLGGGKRGEMFSVSFAARP